MEPSLEPSQEEALFGRRLKSRRTVLGLTQEELARRAGGSTATVRMLEAEEHRPSPEAARALAEVLGVPAGERRARERPDAAPNGTLERHGAWRLRLLGETAELTGPSTRWRPPRTAALILAFLALEGATPPGVPLPTSRSLRPLRDPSSAQPILPATRPPPGQASSGSGPQGLVREDPGREDRATLAPVLGAPTCGSRAARSCRHACGHNPSNSRDQMVPGRAPAVAWRMRRSRAASRIRSAYRSRAARSLFQEPCMSASLSLPGFRCRLEPLQRIWSGPWSRRAPRRALLRALLQALRRTSQAVVESPLQPSCSRLAGRPPRWKRPVTMPCSGAGCTSAGRRST